jgi:hypothetical protein
MLFQKIYFLRESSLHPKFYSPIFFWDVESSSNYAKKLKLTGIATTTLMVEREQCYLGNPSTSCSHLFMRLVSISTRLPTCLLPNLLPLGLPLLTFHGLSKGIYQNFWGIRSVSISRLKTWTHSWKTR